MLTAAVDNFQLMLLGLLLGRKSAGLLLAAA
jgi:hypothetical protein